MKFGKQILCQARIEWAHQYMDYKGLKKLISRETRSGTGLITVASLGEPPFEHEDEDCLENKVTPSPSDAPFFFRLDRELEKVNTFYLKKVTELQARFKPLSEKLRALQLRPTGQDSSSQWTALYEAVIQFQGDLAKLQQYVDVNGTGFRKILKKFDKRSCKKTKEQYLARQVRVQACFDGKDLSELADACTDCLSQINREKLRVSGPPSPGAPPGDYADEVFRAILAEDSNAFETIVERIHQSAEFHTIIASTFFRLCSEGGSSNAISFLLPHSIDFNYCSDITGRTGLHEASLRGDLEITKLCLGNGSNFNTVDIYGRTPLHYTAMYGWLDIGQLLLEKGADAEVLDHDGYSALIYAISGGHTEYVQSVLKFVEKVDTRRALHIASQYGHRDIAELLLENLSFPLHNPLHNQEDLTPLHLACRAGHAEICQLLTKHGAALDAVDSDKGWTPIFYAAREGHTSCVQILLNAGCRRDVVDESGVTIVYHAAYEGHSDCVQVLLSAGCPPEAPEAPQVGSLDVDEIPSLQLPPPLLPFRIYGHNFLDRKHLIQLQLGYQNHSPVVLNGNSSVASLRLILHPKLGDQQSITLPLPDPQQVYTFEVDNVSNFQLDFTLYPTFGSQSVGHGVALSSLFQSKSSFHVIPLFDAHLKVVGELSFQFNIIQPYTRSTLEVGGPIATYWRAPSLGPTLLSPHHSLASLVTASSLAQNYVQLIVRVTKDRVPVVCPFSHLDVAGLSLVPSQLTHSDFLKVTTSVYNISPVLPEHLENFTLPQMRELIHSALPTLNEALLALPKGIGVCLEVAYDNESSPRPDLSVNQWADAVLDVVYNHAHHVLPQRAFLFTSFCPAICNALNWKQPNYAVFIATDAGWPLSKHTCSNVTPPVRPPSSFNESLTAPSLQEAVLFAKRNHLLGIICPEAPLKLVPDLVRRIKAQGFLLATYSDNSCIADNQFGNEDSHVAVDIQITQGILNYSGSSI